MVEATHAAARPRGWDWLVIGLLAAIAAEAMVAGGTLLFGPGASTAPAPPTPDVPALVAELSHLAGTGGSPSACTQLASDARAIADQARGASTLRGAADAETAATACLDGRDLDARATAARAASELAAAGSPGG